MGVTFLTHWGKNKIASKFSTSSIEAYHVFFVLHNKSIFQMMPQQ